MDIEVFRDFDFSVKPVSNPVSDFLQKDFLEKEVLNGSGGCFMPLSLPTGIGKTYNTLAMIVQAVVLGIQKELEGKSFRPQLVLYVTHSVDNVRESFQSCIHQIDRDGRFSKKQKEVLKALFLRVPSNADTLLDLLECNKEVVINILKLFRIGERSSLGKDVHELMHKKDLEKDLAGSASFQGMSDVRKDVQESLVKLASECYSRLIEYIQKNQLGDDPVFIEGEKLSLISRLIPGVRIERRMVRVLFMTTKKFLHGIQQSKGKYHPAYDIGGKVLVFDEVDRQLQEILGHLVSMPRVDILTRFRSLLANLSQYDFCSKPQYQGIKKIFSSYVDKLDSFSKEYDMRCSFDLDEKLTTNKGNIALFSDKMTTHHTSINKKLRLDFGEDENQHIITSDGDGREFKEQNKFPRFLNRLDRLVGPELYSVVRKASAVYRDNMEKNRSSAGTLSMSNAVSPSQAIASILSQVNLYTLYDQVVKNLIQCVGRQRSKSHSAANVHTRGLRVIEVDHFHQAFDNVFFYNEGYQVSPTGMLADWVEAGACVLGISATAECESVLNNFDMAYLKDRLGELYRELSHEQRQVFGDYFCQERDYRKNGVSITADSQQEDVAFLKDRLQSWNSTAYDLDQILASLVEVEAIDRFHYQWVSKLCKAIQRFVSQPDNRYMMAFLNRSIKPELAKFLRWFVDDLAKSAGMQVKIVPVIDSWFLKKGSFDSEVIAHLEKNSGKLIAITTYQTMATGKNPDYKFNRELEGDTLCQVGRRLEERTDIDTLYLESPTNMINISGEPENTTTDKLLLLSYPLFMQERGSLTRKEVHSWSLDVIRGTPSFRLCNQLKSKYYHNTADWRASVYRLLEQAVGRTARTSMKRRNILLMYDHALVPILALDSRNSVLFSHEYTAIVEHAKSLYPKGVSPATEDNELRRQINRAILHHGRSQSKINRFLEAMRGGSNQEIAKSWKDLRQYVLKKPALVDPPVYGEYYVESPEPDGYDFKKLKSEGGCDGYGVKNMKRESDYDDYLFFSDLEHPVQRVSAQEARLPLLERNEVVRELFQKNGWPLKWPDNARYILTPSMFTNIYKGALGEEVGKAVLSQYGFSLKELPLEHFEKFDAVLDFGGCSVCVDFKFWNIERWRSLPDEVSEKTMCATSRKIREVSLSRLVICNAIGSEKDPICYFDADFSPIDKEFSHSATIVAIPALIDENSARIVASAMSELTEWLCKVKDEEAPDSSASILKWRK